MEKALTGNDENKSLVQLSRESEGAEKLNAYDVKKIESAQSILAMIAPEESALVVPKEIHFGDNSITFNIKRLSYAECSKIDAKKHRRHANGQSIYNQEYANTVGLSWQIHTCVVRNANEDKVDEATGKPLKADWVPLFTLAEVQGDTMMNNPDPRGKAFVYELINVVWEVNSELSFLNQAAAAAQLGTQ